MPLLATVGPDVVVHLGSTSKLLTPTLGVGWMVAPPAVHDAVRRDRQRTGTSPGPAGQLVFAALASHGDLGRHLRRLRRELATRRELVVTALADAGVAVTGDAAGAHVVVPLPDAGAERAVLRAAAARGVTLDGLRRHHGGPPSRYGVTLGYAGPSRAELGVALAALTDVLRSGRAV